MHKLYMVLLTFSPIGHAWKRIYTIHKQVQYYKVSKNMHLIYGKCLFSLPKEMTRTEHPSIKKQYGPMPWILLLYYFI